MPPPKKMKPRLALLVLLPLSLLILSGSSLLSRESQSVKIIHNPEPGSLLKIKTNVGELHLREGKWYLKEPGGRFVFKHQYYDPGFYRQTFVPKDGKVYRRAGKGALFETAQHLKEDFEGKRDLLDLILTRDKVAPLISTGKAITFRDLPAQWSTIVLLSPHSPTVKDYVAFRKKIFKRQAGFVDNRIEVSSMRAHSGKQSLRCYSVPTPENMVTTKSLLETGILHFAAGDDIWFSGWYFLERGRPSTILDFECSWLDQGSGIRVFIDGRGWPYVELKALHKPRWKQKRPGVAFPRNRWVHIKAHFKLHHKEQGVIQLWMDEKKLVDTRGQTLPVAGAAYDRMQVGITANPKQETVLYVDDISLSPRPIKEQKTATAQGSQ